MDDLISRQAALDAMGERPLTWTGGDYELGCRNQYDTDRLAIETVPPVTPKQPGWIPTSVRLPEEKTAVLITTTKGCVIQCMYWGYQNGHHTWRSLGNQYLYWEMDVVAWMPLPTPYREGGQVFKEGGIT